MNYHIEIQRNNVTLAQFLQYCKTQCKKKGIDFNINREEFENPATEYMNSYSVIGDKKKCRFMEINNSTRERKSWDAEYPADDAPAKSEIFKQFACDYQVYVLNFDGTAFNETCEFTFDDEKKGTGYYYQANKVV